MQASRNIMNRHPFLAAAMFLLSVVPAVAAIRLDVDLTDAPRRLIHAHLQIPATAGPLTLEYPQWIPGNHRPTGPIDNLAGLFIKAGGKELTWERDSVDMYGIHVNVPPGVSTVDVNLDFLAVPGATGSGENGSTSPNMTVLEWNCVTLYPAGQPAAAIPVEASLTLPEGWKFGTALTPVHQDGNKVSFETVSLETLIDSPVITGKYFREIPLAPDVTPKHFLDIASDVPEELEVKPALIDSYSRLVREAGALYRSRHYQTYHFLLSLSDTVRGEGLEHHQSSDNGIKQKGLSDPNLFLHEAGLLPHEFTHSWNGKYRRPTGLATPDYKTPMQGNLLWVYEGMTEYWGSVLATRSGLITPADYRDVLAADVATLNSTAGRTWRNLQDTAIAAQILRGGIPDYSNWRRRQDYYIEGELLWLDADTLIRQQTENRKSLNDFVGAFLGLGGNTPAKVVPYTFNDIVAGLNAVTPYDWRAFLNERLQSHDPKADVRGIERAGYKVVFADKPTRLESAIQSETGSIDAVFSLGLRMNKDAVISDVIFDSVAFKAGLSPGMKVIAVNGHAYDKDSLPKAIREAKTSKQPIELITSNAGEFRTVRLDYTGGERYVHLERVSGTPDLLQDILRPAVPNG